MDKKKINNIIKGAAAAGALYGGANVASGPDVVFAADLEEIQLEESADETAETVKDIVTATTNTQEQVNLTETPAAVTGIDMVPQETHINEAADGTDFNNDGDLNDTLDITVNKDEDALASVDQSTIQEGDEGLENPVKVVEFTVTETAGDTLTKEEADSAAEELESKGFKSDEITVSVNEDATENAVDKAESELKDDDYDNITETKDENTGKIKVSGTKYVDDTEGIANAEKELTDDGYEIITKKTDEETGATTVTGTRVRDTDEEVQKAVNKLQDEGYGDITTSTDKTTAKVIISGSKTVDDTYGIASAEKALKAAGCTDIRTETDEDGNTIVSGSMLVDDTEGIENAKEALKAKGYTDSEIHTSKDAGGNTLVTGVRLVDDTYGITSAEKALNAAGYTEITTSVDAEGNTVVTGSKTIEKKEAIDEAEAELTALGYGDFTKTVDEDGNTVITGSKTVEDTAGVISAEKAFRANGFTNIHTSVDDDGNTIVIGALPITKEEAIAKAEKELEDAGYTVTGSETSWGMIFVYGEKLEEDTASIEASIKSTDSVINQRKRDFDYMLSLMPEEVKGLDFSFVSNYYSEKDETTCETKVRAVISYDDLWKINPYVKSLKKNGYTVTARICDDGSTEVTGTKMALSADKAAEAKKKLTEAGYTEILETEIKSNMVTEFTGVKDVTDVKTVTKMSNEYKEGDVIIIDDERYKIISVEETKVDVRSQLLTDFIDKSALKDETAEIFRENGITVIKQKETAYKITASRIYTKTDSIQVNWDEITDSSIFKRLEESGERTFAPKKDKDFRIAFNDEDTISEKVSPKTDYMYKTIEKEKVTVSQTVLKKMQSDSETVAQKPVTISETVATKPGHSSYIIDQIQESASKIIQQKEIAAERTVDILYRVSAEADHVYYGELRVDPPAPQTAVTEDDKTDSLKNNGQVFNNAGQIFNNAGSGTVSNTEAPTYTTGVSASASAVTPLAVKADTDAQEVLGASKAVNGTRAEDDGAVLGASRDAKTGDTAAIAGAASAAAGAGAAGGGFLFFGHKRRDKKDKK